eukprot:753925-Hanusia_phi.AAC.6
MASETICTIFEVPHDVITQRVQVNFLVSLAELTCGSDATCRPALHKKFVDGMVNMVFPANVDVVFFCLFCT